MPFTKFTNIDPTAMERQFLREERAARRQATRLALDAAKQVAGAAIPARRFKSNPREGRVWVGANPGEPGSIEEVEGGGLRIEGKLFPKAFKVPKAGKGGPRRGANPPKVIEEIPGRPAAKYSYLAKLPGEDGAKTKQVLVTRVDTANRAIEAAAKVGNSFYVGEVFKSWE